MLAEEIQQQPEEVLEELLRHLRRLTRQREEAEWADVLPSPDARQEVLDLLDGK